VASNHTAIEDRCCMRAENQKDSGLCGIFFWGKSGKQLQLDQPLPLSKPTVTNISSTHVQRSYMVEILKTCIF